MSSNVITITTSSPGIVWRDAMGPGFAIGPTERLVRVTGDAARRPYHGRR